ncbi:MAG: glycosyltransferase family 2 protein [Spirochaetaceae bacterium]|jgi:glycosyltransferase involved in cell wall biosynthesis|nr:glycosyltransferase family 2 protein [Spirochaetaceae bacterium]
MKEHKSGPIKTCFIIPVYNHGKTIRALIRDLVCYDIPIIIVDDGSDEETKTYLSSVEREFKQIVLLAREKNGGKGAAVMTGIDKAYDLQCDNALQLDADGQHDTSAVKFFLEKSAADPGAVICGLPEFDKNAPKSRVNGRKISVFWAKIVTLSTAIPDALCGFRVYPVESVFRLIHKHFFDKRMGFDVEILVRLYWEHIPLVFYPLQVSYPQGGLSHFHPLRDNIRISFVFTKLFFGMVFRLPSLIRWNFRRVALHT